MTFPRTSGHWTSREAPERSVTTGFHPRGPLGPSGTSLLPRAEPGRRARGLGASGGQAGRPLRALRLCHCCVTCWAPGVTVGPSRSTSLPLSGSGTTCPCNRVQGSPPAFCPLRSVAARPAPAVSRAVSPPSGPRARPPPATAAGLRPSCAGCLGRGDARRPGRTQRLHLQAGGTPRAPRDPGHDRVLGPQPGDTSHPLGQVPKAPKAVKNPRRDGRGRKGSCAAMQGRCDPRAPRPRGTVPAWTGTSGP